jgi:hypothetical protein
MSAKNTFISVDSILSSIKTEIDNIDYNAKNVEELVNIDLINLVKDYGYMIDSSNIFRHHEDLVMKKLEAYDRAKDKLLKLKKELEKIENEQA